MHTAQHSEILVAADIDLLRSVFDQFCETHERLRSDDEMEVIANMMIRLYQSGERDPQVLKNACEASYKSYGARRA